MANPVGELAIQDVWELPEVRIMMAILVFTQLYLKHIRVYFYNRWEKIWLEDIYIRWLSLKSCHVPSPTQHWGYTIPHVVYCIAPPLY